MTPKPQVKTATFSGQAVLNDTQRIILVTFKSEIPKNEMHELGALSQPVYRLWTVYSHKNTHVHPSKKITTIGGLGKFLHRQTSDKNPSVHFQTITQMNSELCTMN
jgi:hypothetical protein